MKLTNIDQFLDRHLTGGLNIHGSILIIMHHLGYPIPRGLCYGLTHMMIMARLADDEQEELEHFNRCLARLVWIAGAKHYYKKIFFGWKTRYAPEVVLKQLDDVAAKLKKGETLSEEEKILSEMRAFCDGVAILQFHDGEKIKDFQVLYKDEEETEGETRAEIKPCLTQDAAAMYPTVESTAMEEVGGVTEVEGWLSIHDPEELTQLLEALWKKLRHQNINKPVAFALSQTGKRAHRLSFIYEPKKGGWRFLGPNTPGQWRNIGNHAETARKIFREFGKKDRVCFQAEVYCNKKIRRHVRYVIRSFKTDNQNLLGITPARAQLRSDDGIRLFQMALLRGKVEDIKKIIDTEENACRLLESPLFNGVAPPLHCAASARDLEVVRLLLQSGANPNQLTPGGFSPLYDAAQNGRLDVARLLLQYGANPEQRSDDGTVLDVAIRHGHTKVAQLLVTAVLQKAMSEGRGEKVQFLFHLPLGSNPQYPEVDDKSKTKELGARMKVLMRLLTKETQEDKREFDQPFLRVVWMLEQLQKIHSKINNLQREITVSIGGGRTSQYFIGNPNDKIPTGFAIALDMIGEVAAIVETGLKVGEITDEMVILIQNRFKKIIALMEKKHGEVIQQSASLFKRRHTVVEDIYKEIYQEICCEISKPSEPSSASQSR